MERIIRNTILQYLPYDFWTEIEINPERLHHISKNTKHLGESILYLMEREIRAKDNFALNYCLQKSKELNLDFKIFCRKPFFEFKIKEDFINNQINCVSKNFEKTNINFKIFQKTDAEIAGIIKKINPHILVFDFNPILNRNYLKQLNCNIVEVDGHNIVPARFLSNKQEYSAGTIRPKIYRNIYPFFTEFNNEINFLTEAELELKYFIENKLNNYNKNKNNFTLNGTSNLSKYLTLGFISSQRVALEILKAKTDVENKEAFLEELIVRKELADNFCLYCKNFKSFDCVSNWAKETLNKHQQDIRPFVYSKKEFEFAKTHNEKWNRIQEKFIQTGYIHSYLRMYWAKKVLEWSENFNYALETLIYLNDKYALDAPSSNGYVGILWAIGGLHDRAFRESPILGKIRQMNLRKK